MHELKLSSKKKKDLSRAAANSNKPLPKMLQSPELSFFDQFYWNAFRQLNTCRNATGPIPWDSIDRYCARHNITGEDYEEFISIIGQVDEAALEHWQKEAEQRSKKNGTNAGGIRGKNPFKPKI